MVKLVFPSSGWCPPAPTCLVQSLEELCYVHSLGDSVRLRMRRKKNDVCVYVCECWAILCNAKCIHTQSWQWPG